MEIKYAFSSYSFGSAGKIVSLDNMRHRRELLTVSIMSSFSIAVNNPKYFASFFVPDSPDVITDDMCDQMGLILHTEKSHQKLESFARQEALSVSCLWPCPDLVKEFLVTGNESLRKECVKLLHPRLKKAKIFKDLTYAPQQAYSSACSTLFNVDFYGAIYYAAIAVEGSPLVSITNRQRAEGDDKFKCERSRQAKILEDLFSPK